MRTSGSSNPSGVLVGHTEGITHVTSKGDNRYLASNGKDQKMLLWDLRMMHSNRDYRKLPPNSRTGFDYRDSDYYGSKSTKRQVFYFRKRWYFVADYSEANTMTQMLCDLTFRAIAQ